MGLRLLKRKEVYESRTENTPTVPFRVGETRIRFVGGYFIACCAAPWRPHMKKHSYFASRFRDGWPEPEEIAPLFLAPPGERWFFETGNDSAGLTAEGVDGTDRLDPADRGRVAVHLDLWAHPERGVQLSWRKWGGGRKETWHSKGDLSRLAEHVRSLHDTPLSAGLFIPYEEAWQAVRDFIETDGERPGSIAWIEESDLPAGTFPAP